MNKPQTNGINEPNQDSTGSKEDMTDLYTSDPRLSSRQPQDAAGQSEQCDDLVKKGYPQPSFRPPQTKSMCDFNTRQRMQRIPPEATSRQGRPNGIHSSKRTRLLIFIKIVLKCLDCEDPSLQLEAKQIITECTRKNREGIPGYDPLADAITRQLRTAVGELHWNRAENLMSHYLKTHYPRSRNTATTLNVEAVKFAAV